MSFIIVKSKSKPKRRPKNREVFEPLEKQPFRELQPRPPVYRAPDHSHIRSRCDDELVIHHAPKDIYEDPEMIERERLAQIEIEHKKTCVAPAFNKGNLTLIASKEQAM